MFKSFIEMISVPIGIGKVNVLFIIENDMCMIKY